MTAIRRLYRWMLVLSVSLTGSLLAAGEERVHQPVVHLHERVQAFSVPCLRLAKEDDLGQPASMGSQNDLSYAVFPDKQRLAINLAGRVTVYDTGAHQIGSGNMAPDAAGWF